MPQNGSRAYVIDELPVGEAFLRQVKSFGAKSYRSRDLREKMCHQEY